LVKLGRHTAQQLRTRGEPSTTFALKARARLEQPRPLREAPRHRLPLARTTARRPHEDLRQQATRLTQGKQLRHATPVTAYALTIAPLLKGQRHGPAQCGSKPGSASEPATGLLVAPLVPPGKPSDQSYGRPLLDKVQSALDRVRTGPKRPMHSGARALGRHAPCVRQALQARGRLPVGISETSEPVARAPSAQDVHTILTAAGVHRQRTPHQGPLACARGVRRPVVASHIASLLARGAGHGRSKGLEGAGLQQGMTVLAHPGAVMVRIRQHHVAKRAQKFRRFLGLKLPKINECKQPKN